MPGSNAFSGLPWWLSGEDSACKEGDVGLIPGSGRSPGEGSGSQLQYSCLGNPTDRGAWGAAVHGNTGVRYNLVTKEQQCLPYVLRLISQVSYFCLYFILLKLEIIISTSLDYEG